MSIGLYIYLAFLKNQNLVILLLGLIYVWFSYIFLCTSGTIDTFIYRVFCKFRGQ